MRVLVTGASGFIGQRVVARLAKSGVAVRAFLLPAEPVPAAWAGTTELVRGDIASREDVNRAAEGVDGVIHLAAVVGDWASPKAYERITIGGTRNVIDAVGKGRAKLVLASSICVYGDQIQHRSCDEATPFGRPQSGYERSKQEQERLLWAARDQAGLQASAVRLANVYGFGSGPWFHAASAALKAGGPTLVGDGDGNAGLIHVDNAAALLVAAYTNQKAIGEAFNGCDGLSVTWRRYFTDLAEIIGAPPPKSSSRQAGYVVAGVAETIWRVFGLSGRPPVTRGALNLIGSDNRIPSEKARKVLGWKPEVDYETAMAEIAAAVRSAARSAA